jgi:hypothetical protein
MGSAGADEFAFSVFIYSVSSSIAKVQARGRGRYRGVLQSPSSASRGDYKFSGRVERAHFDAAGAAYSAVQDFGEDTSKVSASRRVARVLRRDLQENEWRIVLQKKD